MTNYEHYKEQIEKIVRLGLGFGIDKETEKISACYDLECRDCVFFEIYKCIPTKIKWANAEYVESEVDWSKIPVDTPILVRNSTDDNWLKRYFAKYEDGIVYAFYDGRTSWNSEEKPISWPYAKLAEVDNGI